jgi:eukaryotic-like serine/threonine-protein kinase
MTPTRLGPYTIRGKLGRGGMGTVYEAADASGAVVAVKTLSAQLGDDPALRRRFEAEIEALKSLDHPGIVRLLAFGEEEGRPFFAMELVRGHSLEELLKNGRRFDWKQTAGVAIEIMRALKSAHDRGIIHRDLKPANLLFPDEPRAGGGVKLADFGIAKLFGDSALTQAGTVVGTAEYMAPEQAGGEPVDQRSDLYAAGLVMFAMLAGRPPFRGGGLGEVLRRQRSETPPRISAIVPDVPAELDDLIARLLAKQPTERPASALAVGRMLAAIEATGEEAAATLAAASPTVADRSVGPAHGIDLLAATRATGTDQGGRLTIPAERQGGGIDADAPTRAGAAATAAEEGSLAHRPTAADEEPAAIGLRFAGSRFTTVEELHRAAKEETERAARRDRVVGLTLAGGLVAAVLAVGYAVLQPATADQLHERIMAIADDPTADLRDARPVIDLFLARFPADERGAAVAALRRELDLDALERRSRRRPRENTVLDPLERDYRAAMDREAESPLACLAALEAILALHGETAASGQAAAASPAAKTDATLWLDLVRRQIERVRPLADREQREDAARAAATLAEAAELAAEAATAAEPAERDSLLARRRQLLEGLVEIFADRGHVAAAVAEARTLLAIAPQPDPETAP